MMLSAISDYLLFVDMFSGSAGSPGVAGCRRSYSLPGAVGFQGTYGQPRDAGGFGLPSATGTPGPLGYPGVTGHFGVFLLVILKLILF